MKKITESVQATLDAVEKELRVQLIDCAEMNDYTGAAFANGCRSLGNALNRGIASRWMNVLRLKSMLAKGEADYLFVCRELSSQDIETLKRVHKAMPE